MSEKTPDEKLKEIQERRKGRRSSTTPRPLTESETEELSKIYGSLKRKEPALMKSIEDLARDTGKNPIEVLKDALYGYSIIRRTVRAELSVEQLYEAWQILREFMDVSRNIFFDYADLMFSEQTIRFAEFREEAIRGVTPEVARESKVTDIETRLMDKLWMVIDPMLDMIIGQLLKAWGMKPPEGAKIPVEVKELKEDEIPLELRKKIIVIQEKKKRITR